MGEEISCLFLKRIVGFLFLCLHLFACQSIEKRLYYEFKKDIYVCRNITFSIYLFICVFHRVFCRNYFIVYFKMFIFSFFPHGLTLLALPGADAASRSSTEIVYFIDGEAFLKPAFRLPW